MIKTLMGSIRDYMKVTVATPLLVLGEVIDRKSTRLNSSHISRSRMPSSA